MDKSEIIDYVRDLLGFHKSLATDIIHRHMNVFQQEVEKPHGRLPLPWFLFNGTKELFTKQGIDYIDLPEDFIQQDDEEEWHPYIALENKKGLLSKSLVQTADWGTPKKYDIIGDRRMYLAPTPDDEYLIVFPYFARTEKLSTVTESLWFHHFPIFLAARTAQSIAESSKDEATLSRTDRLYKIQRDEYLVTVEAWKHHMREYKLGPS